MTAAEIYAATTKKQEKMMKLFEFIRLFWQQNLLNNKRE